MSAYLRQYNVFLVKFQIRSSTRVAHNKNRGGKESRMSSSAPPIIILFTKPSTIAFWKKKLSKTYTTSSYSCFLKQCDLRLARKFSKCTPHIGIPCTLQGCKPRKLPSFFIWIFLHTFEGKQFKFYFNFLLMGEGRLTETLRYNIKLILFWYSALRSWSSIY